MWMLLSKGCCIHSSHSYFGKQTNIFRRIFNKLQQHDFIIDQHRIISASLDRRSRAEAEAPPPPPPGLRGPSTPAGRGSPSRWAWPSPAGSPESNRIPPMQCSKDTKIWYLQHRDINPSSVEINRCNADINKRSFCWEMSSSSKEFSTLDLIRLDNFGKLW